MLQFNKISLVANLNTGAKQMISSCVFKIFRLYKYMCSTCCRIMKRTEIHFFLHVALIVSWIRKRGFNRRGFILKTRKDTCSPLPRWYFGTSKRGGTGSRAAVRRQTNPGHTELIYHPVSVCYSSSTRSRSGRDPPTRDKTWFACAHIFTSMLPCCDFGRRRG